MYEGTEVSMMGGMAESCMQVESVSVVGSLDVPNLILLLFYGAHSALERQNQW